MKPTTTANQSPSASVSIEKPSCPEDCPYCTGPETD